MKFFYIVTLGCKVNQYETQSLRESWQEQGLVEVQAPAKADVLVVNSCAITAKAVADVRATIRKLHRESPSAAIIVTGCAAEVMEGELEQIEGVAQVVRRLKKESLLHREALTGASSEIGENNIFPPFSISDFNRSRAVLKIQDGCSHCCTYCIVPRARGGAVSRPLDEALNEAERLLKAGFAEIVISGINLRQFRLLGEAVRASDHVSDYAHAQPGGAESFGGKFVVAKSEVAKDATKAAENKGDGENSDDFWSFIAALEERFAHDWAGKARFRISSLEPGQLTEKGVATLGNSQLVAPHLHLSLQSGSDAVLERMGRGHYTVRDVTSGLQKLARVWPTFALGADIICGFPGETEAEHAQTVELLETLPFSYAHVFPYSRRPHTLAAKMSGQIDGPVKKQRAAQLRGIAKLKEERYKEAMLQHDLMHVALEQGLNPDKKAHGLNQWYVDCVFVDAQEILLSSGLSSVRRKPLVKAVPVGIEKGCLLVKALNE